MCYMDNSTHIRAAVLAAVLKVLGLGPLGRGQTQPRRHNPNTKPASIPDEEGGSKCARQSTVDLNPKETGPHDS